MTTLPYQPGSLTPLLGPTAGRYDEGGVVKVGRDQPLKLTAAWARQGLLSLPATLPGKAPGGVPKSSLAAEILASGGQVQGAKRRLDDYAAWTGKQWGWQRSAALCFATREEA
jgi:hypothetical protein